MEEDFLKQVEILEILLNDDDVEIRDIARKKLDSRGKVIRRRGLEV